MQVRGVERRGRRHPPPVPEARQPLSKTKPDGSGACPSRPAEEWNRAARSKPPVEPPAPASAREAVRGRLVLQRHLHPVISYLYYINARRQGEAACRGGQYEPSLQVVHVRAGVVRQVEAHFATRHRDALGEGGRADARASHGAVVREVIPPVSHGVGLGATGGHVHRDGVVHARKRLLAAEDGRVGCQHGQFFQPPAIIEEKVARLRQPLGQGQRGEARATVEEVVARLRQPGGQGQRGEARASIEEVVLRTRQPLGQGERGEACAIGEEELAHARQPLGQGEGGQPATLSEEAVPHTTQPFGQREGGEARAIGEETLLHAGRPGGQGEGGELRAIGEKPPPHTCQPGGEVD